MRLSMISLRPKDVYRWVYALLLLFFVISSVSAYSSFAILTVTDVIVNPEMEDATNYIIFNNSLTPKAGAITFSLEYDEQVIKAVNGLVYEGGVLSNNLSSPILCSIITPTGLPNGEVVLAAITFQSIHHISSETELGLNIQTLVDTSLPPIDLISDLEIKNGTFRISTDGSDLILPTSYPLSSKEEVPNLLRSEPLLISTQDDLQKYIPPPENFDEWIDIGSEESFSDSKNNFEEITIAPTAVSTPGFCVVTILYAGLLGLVLYCNIRGRV